MTSQHFFLLISCDRSLTSGSLCTPVSTSQDVCRHTQFSCASFSSAHWTTCKASAPSFLLLVKVDTGNSSLIWTSSTLLPQLLFNNTDGGGLRNKTGFIEFFLIFKIQRICGGRVHAYHASHIQVRGQFAALVLPSTTWVLGTQPWSSTLEE